MLEYIKYMAHILNIVALKWLATQKDYKWCDKLNIAYKFTTCWFNDGVKGEIGT